MVYKFLLPEWLHDQSLYTKSGCRSPNSIQAFKFPSPSPSLLATTGIYFASSFARSSGRFLTLFLNDRYATLRRAITTRRMELVKVDWYETKKGQGNRSGNLQNEIHGCCFPEFGSFIAWKTPDTQNAALKDTK